MNILELSHVSKSFGAKKVIDDLSFAVPEHSIFGFIGQNGAGKTTTMKMALGLLKVDSGEITINNETVSFGQNRTNRYIGYLPDVPEFYTFMTPAEYLTMCGRITGMPDALIKTRSTELLRLVGLNETKHRIRGFSRGMKQRLGIAQALLNSPKLLICDEPTSALDPAGRKEILDILCSVKEHTTVLFSTHILSDVERICDRIAFLHNGRLALNGTLEEVKNIHSGSRIEIEFCNAKDAETFLLSYPGCTRIGETKLQLVSKQEKDMHNIMTHLSHSNLSIQRLERLESALEDLFLEVITQ